MAFDISPLHVSEIDTYTDLCFSAFTSSKASYSQCFYPNGWSPSVRRYLRRGPEKNINNPDNHYILIRDSVTKEVLGGAHWEIQAKPKSTETLLEGEERARKERESQPSFEGVNDSAFSAFRHVQATCHREILGGQAHVYLGMLVVFPQHQRRGVGHAAMNWGLEKADALGLPAYLESSQAGKGLYERFGFKVVKPFPFDPQPFGQDDLAEHYCMLRESVSLGT